MLLLNDYVFGKELFIRFTVRVSHERFSNLSLLALGVGCGI